MVILKMQRIYIGLIADPLEMHHLIMSQMKGSPDINEYDWAGPSGDRKFITNRKQ